MFGLGVQELLIILVIILIFFGADKIPQLAKSLGKGVSEFKKAQQDLKQEIDKESEPVAPNTATTEEPVVTFLITCPACHGQIPTGSTYCSQCGKQVNQEERCEMCHRLLQSGEKYCPNCGQLRDSSQGV